jgi:hypothetical protein
MLYYTLYVDGGIERQYLIARPRERARRKIFVTSCFAHLARIGRNADQLIYCYYNNYGR